MRTENRNWWGCPVSRVWVRENADGTFAFDYPGRNRHQDVRFLTMRAAVSALAEYAERVIEHGGEDEMLALLCNLFSLGPSSLAWKVQRGEIEGVPSRADVVNEWRMASAVVSVAKRDAGIKVSAQVQRRPVAKWTERHTITDDNGDEYSRTAAHAHPLGDWGEPEDRGWFMEVEHRTEKIEWRT